MAYLDSKNRRILLRDGTSVITDFEFARRTILKEDLSPFKVLRSEDSELYDFFHHSSLSTDLAEVDVDPKDHSHTKEDYDYIVECILGSDRFEETEKNVKRLQEELDFFDRTNNILFLKEVKKLIEKFKESGILWGVGRGSSCASYVMYLLEVTDVNPLMFDIPFSELSKE